MEKRTVDLQASIAVIHETHLSEPIHEKAYSRTSGAHHFSQSFLTDFGNYGFRFAFLAEVRK